jgi:hypothetical protein
MREQNENKPTQPRAALTLIMSAPRYSAGVGDLRLQLCAVDRPLGVRLSCLPSHTRNRWVELERRTPIGMMGKADGKSTIFESVSHLSSSFHKIFESVSQSVYLVVSYIGGPPVPYTMKPVKWFQPP